MTDLVKTKNKKQKAQRSKQAEEKTVGDKNRDKNRRGKSNQQESRQQKNAYSKVSQFLTKNLRKIGVAAFFLALLVVVFVGSSIGFTKCEPGFRNVRMYSGDSKQGTKNLSAKQFCLSFSKVADFWHDPLRTTNRVSGLSCVDIDECSLNRLNRCSPLAFCTNSGIMKTYSQSFSSFVFKIFF